MSAAHATTPSQAKGRKRWRTIGTAVLLPMLAGCHSLAPLAAMDAVATPLPAAWQLRGRVVLHTADKRRLGGWLLWRQRDEQRYELTISHTFGGALRLEWDGAEACLRRSGAAPQCAADPTQLARQLSGGESLPVAQLGHWLLGRAAPGDEVLRSRDGHPRRLVHGPWQLRFGPHRRGGSALSLPRQIELWRAERLVLRFLPQTWAPTERAEP